MHSTFGRIRSLLRTRAVRAGLPALLLLTAVLVGTEIRQEPGAGAARHPAALQVARYGSMPKGVVLEGVAVGIPPIETVAYRTEDNTFVINGEHEYPSAVSRTLFLDLLRAVAADDRVGVSITRNRKYIAYGGLDDRGDAADVLFEADKFLSGVVYGREDLIKDTKLPGGYVPDRVAAQKPHTAVSFVLADYAFNKVDGKLRRSGVSFEALLVPLTNKKAEDGGHLVDMDLLESGEFGKENQRNMEHLAEHKAAYMELPRVARAIDLGEAAAFLRYLKRSEYDLAALAAAMQADG